MVSGASRSDQADSSEITRKAKSNLAFALGILPAERRRDVTSFYAYCRIIDDLADDEGIPEQQRREALASWKLGLREGFAKPTTLQRELLEMRERHQLPAELLIAIIEGCEMDLEKTRYETWEDLDAYVWKVACAVGLVCIRLFGCTNPRSEVYAEALGRALQLTNILRDVGEDMGQRDRIYLPLEDLRHFGYSESDLGSHRHDDRFLQLMEFEAARAWKWYEQAAINLVPEDSRALRPAMIMAGIYQKMLSKMQKDRFRVFDRRYRVGKLGKLVIGLRHLLA